VTGCNGRRAGVALLIVGTTLLLTAPTGTPFPLPSFCSGLLCLVAGALLATGLVGTEPGIAALRTAAVATNGTPPRPEIGEHRYRYPPPTGATRVLFALLALLFAVLAPMVAWTLRHRPAEAWVEGLSLATMGTFLPLYLHLHRRWYLRLDTAGLHARTHLRHVEAPWSEIVALRVTGGPYLGTLFKVYTRTARLSFSHAVDGAEELTQLIAEATGLRWE